MGKCSTKNKNRSFSNSPSVNQVETMVHSSEANVMDIHDYSISMALRSDADIIPLPETPEKLPVAKKSRVAVNDDVPNSVLLAAIEKIGKLQEESLSRLQSVELSVQENTASIRSLSSSMEFFGKEIKDVNKRVASLENMVSSLAKENESLWQSCLELDEYKRRWNLRAAGVPESMRK